MPAPLLVLLLALVASVGCNKDEAALAALNILDETSQGIVTRVTDNPDKLAGVLAARKFLDEQTPQLEARMTALGDLKDYQVSDAVRKQMASRLGAAASAVAHLPITYARERVEDPAFDKAVIELVDAFEAAAIPWAD